MQKLLARLLVVVAAFSSACVGEIGATTFEITDGTPDAGKKKKDGGAQQSRTSEGQRKCPSGDPRPLASHLRITEVALYQTVKIPLVQEGVWLTDREAPIIRGKRGILRVYVEPLDGYEPRPVEGVLALQNGNKLEYIFSERSIDAVSSDDVNESVFTFEIMADQMGPALQLGVALEEVDCELAKGTAADARFPTEGGRQPVDTQAIGPLRVVVVPMSVEDRVPTIGDEERQNIRDALLAYYPISTIEIGIHTPYEARGDLTGTEGGAALAEELLNQLRSLRLRDRPPDNVYYLGLYQPAPSFRAFCASVCVLGLAPQTIRTNADDQIAVGAFFETSQSYDTMAHELGHAHGRGHSPCDSGIKPKGLDANYPVPNGAIGDYGWDSRTSEIVSPTRKDVMGYCEPRWISSYTYRELAKRSLEVNVDAPPQALVHGVLPAVRWRYVMAHADGRVRWGSELSTRTPGGTLGRATVLDASKHEVAKIDVYRVPLSHTDGEFVYMPEPGPQWDTVILDDRKIELREVLAASP